MAQRFSTACSRKLASGTERSDEAASAVFFILHLAGEKQDTRAFRLLCRLALDGEAVEAGVGGGIPNTPQQNPIKTHYGQLATPQSPTGAGGGGGGIWTPA